MKRFGSLAGHAVRPAFAVTLLFTVASGCSKPAHPTKAEGPAIPVTVAVAREEPFALVYRASGTVRGKNTAILASKTTAYVRNVRVRSGDHVTAGQQLIDLEANDTRASVARAHAAFDQSTEAKTEAENALVAARAAAKMAKSSYDRAAALLQDKAIPQQQFDEAEARWHGASAQEQMAEARVRGVGSRIDEAKAALGEANAMLGYSNITAPFSGRVLERRVDPGALATPGSPLLVIGDEGSLRVEAAVEESRSREVKLGDEADIEIDTLPKPVVGTIGEIVPNVDVASRAFLVKIDLPKETGAPLPLRPGTFARVGFHVGTQPRLAVPTTAIHSFGALDRVFVVDDKGSHVHLRMITHGDSRGELTEVLSGLSPNERVVVSPPRELRDGSAVEVRP